MDSGDPEGQRGAIRIAPFRGWPTPFAAAVDSRLTRCDEAGRACAPEVMEQLALVGRQVADFALRGAPPSPAAPHCVGAHGA